MRRCGGVGERVRFIVASRAKWTKGKFQCILLWRPSHSSVASGNQSNELGKMSDSEASSGKVNSLRPSTRPHSNSISALDLSDDSIRERRRDHDEAEADDAFQQDLPSGRKVARGGTEYFQITR